MEKQIIAILPVENINDNPALQPLCEGLPETFTARLSKLQDIRDSYWVAPASEMRRQDVNSASQAHTQYGADLVVMSSIHTVADSTKFSINLVDANNMRQLGSEQVVVASENLVGLEQQGIRAMLNMMRMEINPNIAQITDENDTTNSQVYEYLRGTLSKADGEFEQAITHFRNALEIDPGYGPAYRGLAEVYERQGEEERAVATYKKAISRNPDSWEGYRDLGKYYVDRGRYESAIDQFRKVVELIPDNSMAYSNLGAAYHYNGQVENAQEMYEKALELDNNAIAASNLGVIYYSKRQFEEAATMFETAVNAYPDRYDVWGNLAAAYEYSGRPEEARKNYRTAIDKALNQLEEDSANVDLLGNLGAYYSDLGDTANAIKYIKRATELNPSLDRVRQRAVAIYEELGMRGEALRWIDSSMTSWVESQPDFQDLIEDPRYRDLKEQWSDE